MFHPRKPMFPIAFLLIALGLFASAAAPLESLEGCTFVPTEWADGDSFAVRLPDGKQKTIRLYGADCVEWHVNDASDERRLRAQRRYFGITNAAPTARGSIEMAKRFGRLAAEETATSLAKPFTVHTAFSDARGDGRHPRVYGFITCGDGRDLATHLVASGLARAYGVARETPDGRPASELRAHLADIELQAAKRGRGIWAETDWDKLPEERREQRDDDAQVELAIGTPALAPGQKLDPNTAARDDLMKLPGIGEAMANRIIEHRPYAAKAELLKVPGIGPAKLRKLRPHIEIAKGVK